MTSLTGDVTVTLQGFESNTNPPFSTTGLAGPALTLSTVSGVSGTSPAGTFTAPFSITEVATIVFQTAGHLSLNFTGDLSSSPSAVPEPASMMLFGTVLIGMSMFMRRRGLFNT